MNHVIGKEEKRKKDNKGHVCWLNLSNYPTHFCDHERIIAK
jgi:hypothetical protein